MPSSARYGTIPGIEWYTACTVWYNIARFAISTCIAWYGAVHIGPLVTSTRTARYQAVPSKIDRRRPIEEEIDRWRSIEEEKGKKKRRRKKNEEGKKEYLAHGRGRFFSHARRRSVSPRGEKDRGD
ncbi:hypothetical protein B296_00040783, partial [Ensete ventricosum]